MWLSNLTSDEKTPEELLDVQEEQQALYRAIQQLKPTYREVLILRGIKGLSAKETAEILNWSENKVNVTLHRAMKAVKDKLELEGKELIGNAI
jgi:RNA polymerase sigma-70 factor (ECF subfamily)